MPTGSCSTRIDADGSNGQEERAGLALLDGVMDQLHKRGTMAVISGKLSKQSPSAVQFRTPSSILGVRGTEFVIEVGDGE